MWEKQLSGWDMLLGELDWFSDLPSSLDRSDRSDESDASDKSDEINNIRFEF
jgi:hypothetical protein